MKRNLVTLSFKWEICVTYFSIWKVIFETVRASLWYQGPLPPTVDTRWDSRFYFSVISYCMLLYRHRSAVKFLILQKYQTIPIDPESLSDVDMKWRGRITTLIGFLKMAPRGFFAREISTRTSEANDTNFTSSWNSHSPVGVTRNLCLLGSLHWLCI